MPLRLRGIRERLRRISASMVASFWDAATAFEDPLSITISDPLHSDTEERFVLIGLSRKQHLVVVAHVERGDLIRIISARIASRAERLTYEEG